jgi:phospholipid/cholesterol/gamma-HCH transport system permease protein
MNEAVDPDFALDDRGERPVLSVTGDWVVATLATIDQRLRDLKLAQNGVILDVSGLGRVDTAGAFVLDRTLRQASDAGLSVVQGEHDIARSLIEQIGAVSDPCDDARRPGHSAIDLLERLGKGTIGAANELIATLSFLGQTVLTMLRLLFVQPAKMRWTSIVAVMEEAGLDAIPIVAFLTFFVGMVVAFIGATTLQAFDLEIYTVELIGYSMLREFGVILTGIVLAGRTNSSFTAQIGTMKMRQELDAMKTLGLSPMEVLVVPRVLAMLLMTPMLAFAATLAGMAGGMMVGWLTLDISPAMFLDRIRNAVPMDQFWIGMSKAPVFGFVLALIGCRQGLLVGGSVQSLGSRTTSSVVQAIFAVIVIDALFAIFYMELGI